MHSHPRHEPLTSQSTFSLFASTDEIDLFLARTNILVCLLPHTPDTDGMLNAELLSKLAKDGPLPGPVLINAGRGM